MLVHVDNVEDLDPLDSEVSLVAADLTEVPDVPVRQDLEEELDQPVKPAAEENLDQTDKLDNPVCHFNGIYIHVKATIEQIFMVYEFN